MAKKEKLTEIIKEGVTVEEIEKFARKYTNEAFLMLSIIIATISSTFGFFNRAFWSVLFAGLLAIIGLAFPKQIDAFLKKILKMQAQAEKTTTIIIGIVRIIFAIFIPFVLFAELGLLAGNAFHTTSKEFVRKEEPQNPKEEEHI